MKIRIWGLPPAGGPLLWLLTAQADRGNYTNSCLQNLANDTPPRSVLKMTISSSLPLTKVYDDVARRYYEVVEEHAQGEVDEEVGVAGRG